MHFETTQLAHTFINAMLQVLSLDRFFFSEWENVKHRDDMTRKILFYSRKEIHFDSKVRLKPVEDFYSSVMI